MALPWKDIHRAIFLGGTFLLAIGIPTSNALMSIGGLMLSINWVLEWDMRRKLRQLWSNKAALIFLSFYLIHVLGMSYTSDIDFGLKDLRIKLPFLYLPIIFATAEPMRMKHFRLILMAFVAAVTVGSLRSLWELLTADLIDVRHISVFISHIRFALSVCLAIFILLLSIAKRWYTRPILIVVQAVLAAWLVVFLLLLQSFTGFMVFGVGLVLMLIFIGLRERRRTVRFVLLGLGILIPLSAAIYAWSIVHLMLAPKPVDFSQLDDYSPQGSLYHHDTLNLQTVNGYYMWIYLAEKELHDSWAGRSNLDYYGLDKKGNQLRDILIRYLTSRGLRKDKQGVDSLTDQEIGLIENGVGNSSCGGYNVIKARICEIYWEYENYKWTGDPSGHSVLMRYEYWKTACAIIKDNFLFGVGTGDLKQAFAAQYEKMDSELDPEWRLRSHNQYLSIFAAFGIGGFIVFMIALFLPPFLSKPAEPLLFAAFFIIAILSMITEDTLESQAGATFVAFFYCYLLFLPLKQE